MGKGSSFDSRSLEVPDLTSLASSSRLSRSFHPATSFQKMESMSLPSLPLALDYALHRVALLQLLLADRLLSFHSHIQEGCHDVIQPQKSTDSEPSGMRGEG